ncbi:MAG: M23 family metallopeptidase [Chloroflexi bacterium]|nr:M23 family metallopeptidase [Chloroflexota bacterium]
MGTRRSGFFWRKGLLWASMVVLSSAVSCTSPGADTTLALPTPTAVIQQVARATPLPTAAGPTRRPADTATPRPTATVESADAPVGFPLAIDLRPWRVVDGPEGREVVPPDANGPTVLEVARDFQPRAENDMEANRYGWNCRLHATYEGAPAVDWYLPRGTPVRSTMDGQAELAVITPNNSFAYYGVNPRLYLGLPSPELALYPFSGPSGGMGVFVSVLNGKLRAEYGHLDLTMTLGLVPDTAFLPPYSPNYGYGATFRRPLNPGQETVVARWEVRKGQTVGFIGNTGYSDVPHLHYQIVSEDRRTKYCPTLEEFPFPGWLFRRPAGLP